MIVKMMIPIDIYIMEFVYKNVQIIHLKVISYVWKEITEYVL